MTASLAADPAMLQGNRLFAALPPEMLHEGEPGACFYLVCEGSIRISKAGRGGKQETLGFIEPGSFFGEMALVDGQPRSAQAAAAEASRLIRVEEAAFDRILKQAPATIPMNFVQSVVERLRGANAHYISEVMRNERLALVGAMANSIVHDLKNPIQAIRGCADLIKERSNPETQALTDIIKRASERMLDMAQELLDFAHGQTSIVLRRTSIDQILAELDLELPLLVPPGVQLCREIESAGDVLADPPRFARMILNLAKNAIEAMPHGGILWLRVRERGRHVLFGVSDTGCGIPPEILAKVFEPFVTFGKSKGTGLGMAIVQSVVQAHNGTIKLTSEVNVGTAIEISLPVVVDQSDD
jgi:signal transduction histidine kinase